MKKPKPLNKQIYDILIKYFPATYNKREAAERSTKAIMELFKAEMDCIVGK